mgnify:CR=1 FL=1
MIRLRDHEQRRSQACFMFHGMECVVVVESVSFVVAVVNAINH